MKSVRILLIGLGVILVIAGLLIGLALVPAVQRWAVLRATKDVPGLTLEVGRVSAGFSGAVLENVAGAQDELRFKAARVEADFPLIDLVFKNRLELRRLVATGLEIDASAMSSSPAPTAPATAPATVPGLLAQVQLPFDLLIEDLRVEGRALAKIAPDRSPVQLEYVLTGGKLAPGSEGLFQLNATVRDPAQDAQVSVLKVQAGLRATLTPQRTFSKVSLATIVNAEGQALAEPSQLKIAADLFRTSAGENYEIVVDTLQGGKTDQLLKLQAQLPPPGREFKGNWDLKMRTSQVESFALGMKLPDVDLAGSGKFTFDPNATSYSVQGTLRGQASRLETIDPSLGALGTLKIDATFDGAQQAGILTLTQLNANLAGAERVLDAQLIAPLRYDLEKAQLLSVGEGTEDLLRVNLAAVPLDWIRPYVTGMEISGRPLTGQFNVARATGSEMGAAIRGQVEAGELTVKQNGASVLENARVSLQVEAALRESALEAPVVSLAVRTPAGDTLTLNGKVSTRTGENPPIAVTAKFEANSPKLLATWLPGAAVSIQGNVDAVSSGQEVDLNAGQVEVRQGTGKPLVKLTVQQKLRLNTTTHQVTALDGSRPVARVELGRIPLALLPITGPDAAIGGNVQQGDFEVLTQDQKVLVRTITPLILADVSLTQNRQPALRGLTIEARPQLDYDGLQGFRLQSGDLVVRAASGGPILSVKADATGDAQKQIQTNVSFSLEVPALAAQPLFADAQAVSAGRATGEVRAVLGDTQQVEARLTLNGLVAAGTGQTLPVANVSLRILTQPGGGLSIQAPILLDNAGRRSDVNASLVLSPLGERTSIDGRLSGQQVELQDVLGVLSVFSASAAPANPEKPSAPNSVRPHTQAVWANFSGQLALDLKAVTYGPDWAMTNLAGRVAIEPALLALEKLAASFSETSRLAATMEMQFVGGAMPYRLTSDYSLNEFDTGKLFRALDPEKPATVEGLFNVAGKMSGNGETPARAIERLSGDFQLTSRGGIFRGLQRGTNKISMTSKAVELGASVLGSLIGSDKAVKTAEKVAGQSYHVDQLAQALGELHYDLLSVHLSRDELLNMNLEEIGLVSPELRLTGSGHVAYVEGRSLLEQPLAASLNLAARGKVAELLDKARWLDGTKDELGYSRVRETVNLGGTLVRPDATPFFTRLATAKIGEFLGSEKTE